MKDHEKENQIQTIMLNKFTKEFHVLDSPQVINQLCDIRKRDQKEKGEKYSKPFSIEDLQKERKHNNYLNHNPDRLKYVRLKEKILTCLQNLNQNDQQINLSQILIWKQEILTNFLDEFSIEVSKECKEKGQILQFIWNSVFNIIETSTSALTKLSEIKQKQYLNQILENHNQYQQMIENQNQKYNKKQEERKYQQNFIKALVYNLRFKRKQTNKLYKSLKICTDQLNQFKDTYLDLQSEHVDLLSENRDISKENALNLIKRKQEINAYKRKKYKLKENKKKIRFNLGEQLDHENLYKEKQVEKLNKDLKDAFHRHQEQKRKGTILSNSQSQYNLFENILEDFTVRDVSGVGTECLIDMNTIIQFNDQATDMTGFALDVDDQECQFTYFQKIFQNIIANQYTQTAEIKPKIKTYSEIEIQCDQVSLKAFCLSISKTLDRSYILQQYRDSKKNVRIQKGAITLKQFKQKTEKSTKNISKNQSKISQNRFQVKKTTFKEQFNQINTNDEHQKHTQTQECLIFSTFQVDQTKRRKSFEKQFENYFAELNQLPNQEDHRLDIEFQKIKKFKTLKYQGNMKKIFKSFHQNQSNKSLKSIKVRINEQENNIFEMNKNKFQSSQDDEFESNTFKKIQMQKQSIRSQHQSLAMSKRHIIQDQFGQNISENQFRSQSIISRKKIKHMTYREDNNKNSGLQSRIDIDSFKNIRNLKKKKQYNSISKRGEQQIVSENINMSKNKQTLLNDLNKSDEILRNKIKVKTKKIEDNFQIFKDNFEDIEANIQQNINVLRQELRKMVSKKKNNRKLAISRQQSLCKIISLVYTYAYQIFIRRNNNLQSLIIPLFHYFKIGYGEIKKNDLYLRMLYFLSQTYCHREQSYIFESFFMFLGLNLQQNTRVKLQKQKTSLYLKLLEKLSINFKFPLNIQILYTTPVLLERQTKEVLLLQKYPIEIIDKILERVKLKLGSIFGEDNNQINELRNSETQQNNEFNQIKVNVFKCCQIMIEEIQKIKTAIFDSYLHLIALFPSDIKESEQNIVKFILECLFLKNHEQNSQLSRCEQFYKHQVKEKYIEMNQNQIQNENQCIFADSLSSLFVKINLPQFTKIYFMALNKFKVKEEFIHLNISRRLEFIIKYLEKNKQRNQTEHLIITKFLTKQEKSTSKEIFNKKLMGLIFLKIIQKSVEETLSNILGDDLMEVFTITNKIKN